MFNKIIIICLISIIGPASSVLAAHSVKIGLSLGLSGKYKFMADMNRKGLQLWADKVNLSGGLLGKNVELLIYDDHSDKETAKTLYKKLILQDKVDLLFGPYSSGITGAVLPITEKYGFPLLLLGAASDSIWEKGYKNAFGLFTPASRYTVGFLEMAAMNNINDIAIVYADDEFSTSIAGGAKDWGEKFGLTINLYESFKKGNHDLTNLAIKVKKARSSGLVVCGHFNESVDMLKAVNKVGCSLKSYFATVGPAMDSFAKEFNNGGDFVFSSSQWEPEVSYLPDDHKIFLDPFRKKYNETPSYHAAQAFAAGQIMALAVSRVKSLNKKKISIALSKMDTMSIIGRYKVDITGKQIKHFQITIQRQHGKKEVVWPESLATAKPNFEPIRY